MKPNAFLRRFLAIAGSAALAAPYANATTYYWDVDGTTSGFSTVVGAWNGTNAFWNTDITGGAGGSTTAMTTTSDDLNIVAATTNTGSITLSSTQNAGTLTYGSTVGAVTLTGGTLNFGAAATVTVDSVAATVQSIASTISGASTSFTKAGVGTLALTYLTNTFNPGQINVTGGILRIGNGTATTLNSGSYSGNISLSNGSTLQLWSTSAQTLSGIISGSGGIQKAYGGTLTLSGANTYTGKSQFIPQTASSFQVNVSSFDYITSGDWANHGLGSSLGAPTTVANGTIDLGNGSVQASVTLNYTGAGETTDRILNISFNGSSTPTISAAGSGLLKFTSAPTVNLSSGTGLTILNGAGNGEFTQGLPQLTAAGLSKQGAGTWTLGGSGSFTGPTKITAGILSLSSATALRNSPFDTTSVAGGASAGLKIATSALTLGGITGANAFDGRFTTTSGGYSGLSALTLNTVAGSVYTYTGNIVEGATGMTLTKSGVGSHYLNGTYSYTGLTTVSGGILGSSGTFSGAFAVNSNAIYSPGASAGTIGTLTISKTGAGALTLGGSTGIFDLPSTVTASDLVAVTGGLQLDNTNTVLLKTPQAGTPAGTYTLMTYSGAPTGAGSLAFVNGSTTRGNATLNVGSGSVTLTVAAGGLAGSNSYTGAATSGGTDGWNVAGNWGGGVPTGTVNAVLPDKTSAFNIGATSSTIPTYSGDLWIGNNVTLQMSFTSQHNATIDNVLGTPGTTVIYMGDQSVINDRNSYAGSPNKNIPQIVLLGNATFRNKESTNGAVTPDFNYAISGPFTFTLDGNGGTGNFNAANSFSTLNVVNAVIANGAVAGSFGDATLSASATSTLRISNNTAMNDVAKNINLNNGIFEVNTTVSVPLTLSNRTIVLNGSGGGTIQNQNTASSNANILTINNNLSVTGTGNQTLTLGGANTGNNLFAGNIADGTGAVISLAKAGAGAWALRGTNTYSGTTSIAANTASTNFLIIQGIQALSPNTSIALADSSSSQGTIKILDDNGGTSNGTISRTTVPVRFTSSQTSAAGVTNFFVGNNNTTNGGSSSGTATGNTISLGGYTSTPSNFGATGDTLNITGANGYKLQFASIAFPNLSTKAAATTFTIKLNPTTASLIVAGAVTPSGSTSNTNSTPILNLDGTASGNEITGTISNPSNFPTSNSLGLTKSNTSTWTLYGTNTYSGVTTVSGGALVLGSASALPGGIGTTGGTSALTLSGGVIGLGTGDFTRSLAAAGTVTGVNFATGGGGWAAYNADRLVNLGGASAQVTWATANTGFNAQTLILGASTATHKVTLQNGLDLGNATRTVNVAEGTAAVDAELSGAIIGTTAAATVALDKTGTGVLSLSNANTYTGVTRISGGTLVADNANAIPGGLATAGGTSSITFNGGVLGLGTGNFTRSLAAAGTITAANFTGAGGWAAFGADRDVNLGGAGATITWTTANTGFNSQTLILGSSGATHTVSLLNPIALGSGTRIVRVDNGSATVDGIMSGVLSGTAALTVGGGGTLGLTNANNSFNGVVTIGDNTANTLTLQVNSIKDVSGGNSALGAPTSAANGLIQIGATSNSSTLEFVNLAADQSSNRQVQIGSAVGGSGGAYILNNDADNTVIFSNSAFNLAANVASTGTNPYNRVLRLGGSNTGANTISGAIINNTDTGTYPGGGAKVSVIKQDAGKWILAGTNTYTGTTTVNQGTLEVSAGNINGTSSVIINGGEFKYGSTTGLTKDVTVNSGGTFRYNSSVAYSGTLTLNTGGTLGGGGTVGALSFGGGTFFDISDAIGSNPLDSTTISFSSIGFGIDNLVYNGLPIDWTTILDGTYTLITGTLNFTNLDNFGAANAYDIDGIGGGRTAYFQEGSLQLVVVPEPGAAFIGSLGLLALLRRRRN